MAISDRITSIEEHIKESYQELEGIGIDTTGVNNNLENIPKLIDGYWETLPKVTGEGTSITLDNTKEGKMKINLKGNTSQATTTGKNLLINIRNEGYTVTSNGITFKVNADKSITVSGTATGVASMSLNTSTPVTLTAGTYTLSKKETSNVQVAIWYGSNSVFAAVQGTANTNQKTISQDTTYNNWRTLVVVYQGVTVNTTVYPMLEKSSTATDYEPYTNGASPNPDYPQDVHVVTGDNTINICGKNLFNGAFELGGIDINNGNNDSASDRVRTKEYIPVQPNTEYTISGVKASRFAIFYDSNKGYLGYSLVDSQATSGTITTLTNTAYIRWYVIQTNTNVNEQLELGTTATTYAPYQSASYPISLGNIELCKIRDYQDYIYKDNKKWYKYGAIGKVVLNGSENWIRSGNTSENFFCGALAGVSIPFQAKMGTASDSKCNYFAKGNKSTNNECFDMYNGTEYYTTFALYLSTNKASDVTTFKSWLNTHNTTLYYVSITPVTTEITDATLISQLNALARSYNSQTNISQENNDLASILNATALEEM